MTSREFFRRYFFKTLLVIVVLQLAIILIVQNSNHAPKAIRDQISLIEGRTIMFNPLMNDTDKDPKDDLSIAELKDALHGQIQQIDRQLIYTPNKGFFGNDSIAYTISDGRKTSKPVFITIEVIENRPPIAQADSVSTYNGLTTPISVLANDVDKENDSLFVADFTLPKHGKLNKTNNVFFYTSTELTATNDQFEYKVSDGKSIKKTTVNIDIKSKSDKMYPWFTKDVGNNQIKGNAEKKNKRYNIAGAGADIWANNDAFTYMYQFQEGDFEIFTKVEHINAIDDYTKGGIMVREDLGKSSRHLFLALHAQLGTGVYQRKTINGQTLAFNKNQEILPPYYLKVKRQENKFTFSIAKDTNHWNEVYSTEFNLPNRIYLGLVCCSHNTNQMASVEYSNTSIRN